MKKTLISSIIATMLLSATLPHFAYAKNGNQNNDLEVNNEEVQTIENFAQVKNEVVTDNFKEIFVDQEIDEDILISIDDEVNATVLPVPLVVVLATIARYGFTRAVTKHGVVRVTQATTTKDVVKTKLTTDTAARELASELGYSPINRMSMGAKVFERTAKDAVSGPQFIVRDRTAHVGGVWKGASSIEGLSSKSTRSGTYDAILDRIAD